MRITVNNKKYWVYWDYQFEIPLKKEVLEVAKNLALVFNLPMPQVNKWISEQEITTTCYILDDSIRVKDENDNPTGLDNVLAAGVVVKYTKDRHCKAIARAESLNKAIFNLFGLEPDRINDITIFNHEVSKSGVRFEPKVRAKKIKPAEMTWEEWQQL